ncbi:MAG: type II toxin-antitoxin system RelE/ParE family toxin [Ignavibacteriales bacterium]|nr:type II toxin-antitoxin system RelE/ParE family toxin [Ignavibacteriales bacterium]
MVKFKLQFKKSAAKELMALLNKEIKRILQSIDQLIENPRPINSKKLSASEKYRLRIGNYRVLYEIQDQRLIIFIVKIAHRKEAYKS